MNRPSNASVRPIGLGVTSVVMGAIALGLFALPILGIPLAAVALLCGIVGLVASVFRGAPLGWPLLGVLVAGVALSLGITIGKAPFSFVPSPRQAVSEVPIGLPYVAPPARPGAP